MFESFFAKKRLSYFFITDVMTDELVPMTSSSVDDNLKPSQQNLSQNLSAKTSIKKNNGVKVSV